MASTVRLQAPAGSGLGGAFTNMPSGTSYQTDALGQVSVQLADYGTFLGLGFLPVPPSPPANFRNLLDGGDATTNPWQRGTSFSNIGATNTYTADRWFMVASSGSSATMTKTASTSVPTFSQSFVFGRPQSNGTASTITVGQVLETLDSVRVQGQPVTFSFWASANSGFLSPTSGSMALGVQISYGFGTDQSASAFVNNTWTTQTNAVSTTQALTITPTRYSFTGNIPATATQVGVLLNYTPSSTTALANETVNLWGLQLEDETPGIGAPTNFEHRDVVDELERCQRYYFQANEPASGVALGMGQVGPTNSATFVLQLPVQMRVAPTVTVTQGSFGAAVFGAYAALTTFSAGTTHTPNYISVFGLVTAVSGQAVILVGGSTTALGNIKASADL